LGLGDQGIDVEALQLLLTHHGFPAAPSGLFGSVTEQRLREFQASRGLPEPGVANNTTWPALAPDLGPGDAGPAVLALQRQLAVKHGFAEAAVPGLYEAGTATAVEAFQAHMALPVTGLADAATWRALLWHFQTPDFAQPEWCVFFDTHDEWGAGSLVAPLERAAEAFLLADGSPVGVGDISLDHGGFLLNHTSHQEGLDVDLRMIRVDRQQCDPSPAGGCEFTEACYDRNGTRVLINSLLDAAHGHIPLIIFDDPALQGYRGVVRGNGNHSDHLHVRYCEPFHANASYDGCFGQSLGPV
jgi:hypothetical protein